jgi:hypothetical protein
MLTDQEVAVLKADVDVNAEAWDWAYSKVVEENVDHVGDAFAGLSHAVANVLDREDVDVEVGLVSYDVARMARSQTDPDYVDDPANPACVVRLTVDGTSFDF